MTGVGEIVDLVDRISDWWYDRKGLAVAVGAAVFFTMLLPVPWAVRAVVAPIVSMAVLVFWLQSQRPPHANRDRVGIGIIFEPTTSQDEQKFAEDFVREIRQLLLRGRIGPTFQVIVSPRHVARSFAFGEADAIQGLMRKMQCSFLLAGSVRVRKLNGKDHLVLDLLGSVAHKPIPEKVQQRFAREFGELLPRRFAMPSDQDLIAFTFTGEATNLVAKYIIGMAAALSGDLGYAESLYDAVHDDLRAKTVRSPVADKIASRLPYRLAEIHEMRAIAAFQAWCDSHNPDDAAEICQQLSRIDPALLSQPRYANLRAISAFVVDRDPDAALAILEPLKYQDDGVWYWNVGFLHAYKGNLKKASQLYRKGALARLPPEVPAQLEEFMTWVLATEPDKVQIHLCLGILNRDVKGDSQRAREEFEAFLRLAPTGRFERERALIKKELERIA